MTRFNKVISRLRSVTGAQRPNCWNCSCPCKGNHANGDKRPSALVFIDDSGRLGFWCAKGCKWNEAVEWTNTEKSDWFPEQEDKGTYKKGFKAMNNEPIATYDYCDEDGELKYQVCRTEPKDFFQRRPVPGFPGEWINTVKKGAFTRYRTICGGFAWHGHTGARPPADVAYLELDEVKPILYNLPNIKKAVAKMPVIVVEGEKSANRINGLGLLATCSSGGAGKWRIGYGGTLCDHPVVVFPDHDEVGMTHAANVVASLIAYGGPSVRFIRQGLGWDAMEEGSDVYDWIEKQAANAMFHEGKQQRERLIELIKLNPEYKPAQG